MSFKKKLFAILFPDWDEDTSCFEEDFNNNDKNENENNENKNNIEKNITLNLFINIYEGKHNKENHSREETVH